MFAMIDGAIYSQNYALLFKFKCSYKKKRIAERLTLLCMLITHTHSACTCVVGKCEKQIREIRRERGEKS